MDDETTDDRQVARSDTPQRGDIGLSSSRILIWFRRLMWLLALTLTTLAILLWLGAPTWWLAPTCSFTCAEITRRICAESNPDVSLRWRDLLRLMRDPTVLPGNKKR